MRAVRGFWVGMWKGEPAALGFAPVASLVEAVRAEVAAERKTVLAAMLAMVSSGTDRAASGLGLNFQAFPRVLGFKPIYHKIV